MRLSNNLENKIPLDTYSRVQLVPMEVQAQLFTTTELQSGSDAFNKSMLVMTFLSNLRVVETLCSFRLVLEGKARK